MLDRLKEAHYRRKFSPDRATRILRIERDVAALPRDYRARDWLEWLWNLPDDLWDEAVALRRDQAGIVERQAFAVQQITTKNRLQSRLQRVGDEDRAGFQALVDEAVANVERMKREMLLIETSIRARTTALEARFDKVQADPRG